MALNRLSILVDDELSEIPLDGVKKCSALFFFQVFIQRVSVLAVDIDFVEQVEVYFAVASEALNLLGTSWLLMAELVARKSEDTQACREEIK